MQSTAARLGLLAAVIVFQRRDFRYDTLTQMSSFADDTLFGDLGSHEIFVPTKTYPPITVKELGL